MAQGFTVKEWFGKANFEQYVRSVGGRDVRGSTIPEWQDLSQHIRDAWCDAAMAVAKEMNRISEGVLRGDK